MRTLLLGTFCAALLTACKTMPPSNYTSLTPAARERVKPFTTAGNTDSLLQEVTATSLRTLSHDHAYTWVVLWAPWCEPTPAYIKELDQYERQLADRDVKLVLVDIQYSNKSAQGKRSALRGGRPGYVLSWRKYGRLAPLRLRQNLLGKRHLDKHGQEAINYVLDRNAKLVLWTDSILIPYPMLEEATRGRPVSRVKSSPLNK